MGLTHCYKTTVFLHASLLLRHHSISYFSQWSMSKSSDDMMSNIIRVKWWYDWQLMTTTVALSHVNHCSCWHHHHHHHHVHSLECPKMMETESVECVWVLPVSADSEVCRCCPDICQTQYTTTAQFCLLTLRSRLSQHVCRIHSPVQTFSSQSPTANLPSTPGSVNCRVQCKSLRSLYQLSMGSKAS